MARMFRDTTLSRPDVRFDVRAGKASGRELVTSNEETGYSAFLEPLEGGGGTIEIENEEGEVVYYKDFDDEAFAKEAAQCMIDLILNVLSDQITRAEG